MKRVLITGATGVIGSALVPMFLQEPDTRITLLLRGAGPEELDQKLRRLLAFTELEPAAVNARLEAIRGDVCQRLLGLDWTTHQRLAATMTHVVHAAGNVKLNQTDSEARTHAVAAIRNVIALSRDAQNEGPFVKLDYVSTVGVAGRLRGLVPEQPITQPRVFRNTYEAAKAEAERCLLHEMATGLPATIHRPSMVVGDSRTGKVRHAQVFYYLAEFLTGARSWGFLPDPGDVRLDIIPVDYVARAIVLAARCPASAGRIFHLCSGPEHALRLMDLTRWLRRLAGARGVRLPRLRCVHATWFQTFASLLGSVLPGKAGRTVRSLPHFLAYLNDHQVFDTAATRAQFCPEGLNVPAVDDYLGAVMTYYQETKGRQ